MRGIEIAVVREQVWHFLYTRPCPAQTGDVIEKLFSTFPCPPSWVTRMHPSCCLVRNTEAFLLTAREIGFSCVDVEESGMPNLV